MDAREIESLSMLSRGFTELKEANPELAYNVMLDILSGINEDVELKNLFSITFLLIITVGTAQCGNTSRLRGTFSPTNGWFEEVR
jgi:hypothetical protein